MRFNISGWRAWAPGLETGIQWLDWYHQRLLPGDAAQADVSFLPPMQRRRLSPLARMAFHVAWPLAETAGPQPVVFASRHGETPRNLGLLTQLGLGEPLSPTHFSLSVHNAVIGLWSMIRQDTSEMTALAAAGDGLEQAVMEAVLLLAEGAASVLVIVAEENQPELYRPWIGDVPFAHALALQLVPGSDWTLEMKATDQRAGTADVAVPPALAIMPLLLGLEDRLVNGRWHWHRSCHAR